MGLCETDFKVQADARNLQQSTFCVIICIQQSRLCGSNVVTPAGDGKQYDDTAHSVSVMLSHSWMRG